MLTNFLIATPLFLAFDFLWLAIIAKKFYISELGKLARTNSQSLSPIWPAAIMVYVFLVILTIIFVIPQSAAQPKKALLLGALMGALVYGVYDLTNYSTLKDWSLKLTIIDILWGAVLVSLVSALTVVIKNAIN